MKSPETVLPEAFRSRMNSLLQSDAESFFMALDNPVITSVRLNPAKPSAAFAGEESVSWCSTGKYLRERPSFTYDPLFHAGAYYVQESSSMYLEQVLKQSVDLSKPLKVLDACAAPGGKSTHLLSLLHPGSLVVCNEVVQNRNAVLRENLNKWGVANAVVTQNDTRDFAALGEFFDVILIDAPCSGEGLFRRDKDAISEWSEKNVEMCVARQKDIMKDLAPALKNGGVIIYSTCTFEEAENEGNIAWACGNLDLEQVALPVGQANEFSFLQRMPHTFRFYPHQVKGEGFFIAAMQKGIAQEQEQGAAREFSKRRQFDVVDNAKVPVQLTALLQGGEWFYFRFKNELHFAPQALQQAITYLSVHLNLKKVGTALGELKGNDVLPSHELALSGYISPGVSRIEVDKDTAIRYLKCETIRLEGEKGFHLLTYQHVPLGWVKVIPNRVNNYYPGAWRILK
jgi:16S rRNA C967 or C1407 C5-methylase (RsmB/RsmF family)/NOL1/NOP2/fmu family ribosome biogenesis protein